MPWVIDVNLWRTTVFRLFLLYVGVFVVSVGGLLGLNYWRSATYIAQQADNLISWEARYLRSFRPDRLVEEINNLSKDVPRRVNYYGLFAPDGSRIAGDIAAAPANPADPAADRRIHRVEDPLQLLGPAAVPYFRAMAVRLKNGNELVLARDVDEITQLRNDMLRSMLWGGLAIVLVGVGLGWLYSARQLRRIRQIQHAARRIALGDLKERLPAGSRDELDLLAGIVNRMLDDISRLMVEVKGACDGIAHDLRTPLIHVRTLLKRIDDQALLPQSQAVLEQAAAQTELLLQRFAAMLRISEIEALNRRSGFADVNLRILLEQVGELYEPLAEEKGISLSIRPADVPGIQGDRPLLFESVSNLVDNAIKFTPSGGTVCLALVAHSGGTCIEVVDSGPGIAESERAAVVQRFYRSPGTRELPGSGLGLSIVSAVLNLHDFSLGIESADPGTRMIIRCWPQSLS